MLNQFSPFFYRNAAPNVWGTPPCFSVACRHSLLYFSPALQQTSYLSGCRFPMKTTCGQTSTDGRWMYLPLTGFWRLPDLKGNNQHNVGWVLRPQSSLSTVTFRFFPRAQTHLTTPHQLWNPCWGSPATTIARCLCSGLWPATRNCLLHPLRQSFPLNDSVLKLVSHKLRLWSNRICDFVQVNQDKLMQLWRQMVVTDFSSVGSLFIL